MEDGKRIVRTREVKTFWGIILGENTGQFRKCVKDMKYMLEFLKTNIQTVKKNWIFNSDMVRE